MSAIWADENKFRKWLEVELAVLRVRERFGQIPEGTAEGMAHVAFVDVVSTDMITRRDEVINHDLNAFVEVMRYWMNRLPDDPPASEACFDEVLKRGHPKKWDHHFHEGMTSYDTEEPAMSLLFREADTIINKGIGRVQNALIALAKKHRGLIMIGRTHGQWAQPVTFGKRCLDWLDMIGRAEDRLVASAEEVGVVKLSGAVGMFSFGPEIEAEVAKELDLHVASIATQIIPLDRRAQHMNTLAELAAVIEKIARDLWLLSQSEIGEVQEPFGKKQKGSSAMPHKKNPITLEKLFGLPRLIRAYAQVMLENVATAHERDISHSSVERIAVPDAYGLTDHMLQQLGRILEGLQVFPLRMGQNLEETREVYASQIVRDLLGARGIAGETAYRFIQKCAFEATQHSLDFSDVFLRVPDEEVLYDLRHEIGATSEFKQAFDPKWWVRHEAEYYRRFGIAESDN